MTFVVGENCINCKFTDCVQVCPVDCFFEGPNFLVIDPDECIDCGLCEPECPAKAIFDEDDVPEDQIEFIEINAVYSKELYAFANSLSVRIAIIATVNCVMG